MRSDEQSSSSRDANQIICCTSFIKLKHNITDELLWGANMAKTFGRLFRDEQGATAVEYGLLVAGVAAVIVVVVFALGRKINNSFVRINSQL